MNPQPLARLNIAVTRPREQADYLARQIALLGGNAIRFPLLEIEAIDDLSELREQVARLDQFNLAIFISPNAVRFGLAVTGTLPRHLRVAAVGAGSAQALRTAGILNVIVPSSQFDSESLLALPALCSVQNQRILIFRGDGGRELLGDTLKARGAHVEYAACYRRSKPAGNLEPLLAGSPNAITISSSEALRHLVEMPGAQALRAIPLFVPHPRIAETAHAAGWQHIIKTASGDDELLSSLVAWANEICA